jgi:hypothetical protein
VRRLLADQRLDLGPLHRPGAQCLPKLLRGLDRRRSFGGPEPHRASRLADRERERPVVGARDEVDRGSHERALDHRALVQRLGERVTAEVRDPGPQPDVHRRRVLGLQRAHRVERVRDRERPPFEQPLARQQRAVELPLRQDHVE